MAETPSDTVPSARALLKERDYLLFWASRWTGSFAAQIQSVAMGWQMYAIARVTRSVQESAFLVGMIGLAAFIPVFLLTLPAGETADRHDRKKVLLVCFAGEIATVLTLAVATWQGWTSVPLLLLVGFLFGTARAFFAPANTALGPMLVPRALLPRAIAWNSLAWQTASIIGPAAGGFLVATSPTYAYFTTFGLYLVAALATFLIRKNAQPTVNPGSRWTLMKEGLAYVWNQKIVFGAISLDLFAVLLGGATALLPVFARDILHVGAQGFGLLRSGPAIGATDVALTLAARPIRQKAGLFMFGGVATFGLATCVFALWPDEPLAFSGGAGRAGRRRHAQRLCPPDPRPAGHARRHARAGGRRLLGLHRGLQRARRVRERRGRPLPGAGGRGPVRRDWRPDRHRDLGGPVSRLAQGRPPRITVAP